MKYRWEKKSDECYFYMRDNELIGHIHLYEGRWRSDAYEGGDENLEVACKHAARAIKAQIKAKALKLLLTKNK